MLIPCPLPETAKHVVKSLETREYLVSTFWWESNFLQVRLIINAHMCTAKITKKLSLLVNNAHSEQQALFTRHSLHVTASNDVSSPVYIINMTCRNVKKLKLLMDHLKFLHSWRPKEHMILLLYASVSVTLILMAITIFSMETQTAH